MVCGWCLGRGLCFEVGLYEYDFTLSLLNKSVVGKVLVSSVLSDVMCLFLRFLGFSSEGCLVLLRRIHWLNGVTSPICVSRVVIRWCRHRDYQRYMCKVCHRIFNDKIGTIFHYSRLTLRAYNQNNPISTPPENTRENTS
jgi:hypothetical protein